MGGRYFASTIMQMGGNSCEEFVQLGVATVTSVSLQAVIGKYGYQHIGKTKKMLRHHWWGYPTKCKVWGNGTQLLWHNGNPSRQYQHTFIANQWRNGMSSVWILWHPNPENGKMEGSIVQGIYPQGFGVLLRKDFEGHENIIWLCEHCIRGKQGCSSRCEKYYYGHWLQHQSLGRVIGEEIHRVAQEAVNYKLRMNDGGASEWCMFDILLLGVHIIYRGE